VTVENEAPLYYGSRCEKYDVVKRTGKKDAYDLFKEREHLLDSAYSKSADGAKIGFPRFLHMHELAPFWKSLFTELGFEVCFSDATNKKTVHSGVENIIVETCFPVKLAHGHVLNLIEKGIRDIFIPSIIDLNKPGDSSANTFACPYAQSLPYTIKASIDFKKDGCPHTHPRYPLQ